MGEVERKKIGSIVSQAFKDADGDWTETAKLVKAALSRQRALKTAIYEELVEAHIWYLVRGEAAKQRQSFFIGRPMPTENTKAFQKAARAIAEQNFYDFQLPGGKKLGDATREDLDAAYSAWLMNAERNMARANWVKAIMGKVPAGKTVREALTEKQIAAIAPGLREAA